MGNPTQITLGDIVEIHTSYRIYAGEITYLPSQSGDCVIIKDKYNGQTIQTYGDFSILLTKKNLDSAQKPA